jgi:hypothetical protein
MKATITPQGDGTFWVGVTCSYCREPFGFLENKESEAKTTAGLLSIAGPLCLDCFSKGNHENEV